jgi:DNA-binding response OmpR family regulator
MEQEAYCQKNILIVDDDSDIVSSLKELFENHGFQVTTAENGRDCLLELEKGFQGIIILDLMMPIMDGAETIKKMTADGFTDQNTIIVLTAKRVQGEEFDEIYPYIYDYITKPFDINDLLKTVKKIAQQSSLRKRV